MPPLGMLKLQVLFALLQLLRKTLLILLPVTKCWIWRRL